MINSLSAAEGDVPEKVHAEVPARQVDTAESPLSLAQERLWFLEKLGLVGPAYNVPIVLRMQGELDVPGLQSSLEQLIRRHEGLRARIGTVAGRGMQSIDVPGPLRLAVEDLSPLPDGDSRARDLIQQESIRTFEVTGGPLFRVRLLRVGAAEHVLLMTVHHIICDRWSAGILISDLSELYQAHVEGRPPALMPLPMQYTDYAQWQREWLLGDRAQELVQSQLQYWRTQLAGAPAALELPTDRRRPPVFSFRGASVPFSCSEQLLKGLQQLARQAQATLFMTLMAAFQLLLSRWSGQADIVVGWPMAGRGRAELEGLVGFFVNSLMLRSRVRRQMSFRELLREVKEAALGAYAHEEVPFEKLVQELRPGRDLSRQPLFQASFALRNDVQKCALPGLSVSVVPADTGTSKFDLSLFMSEEGPGLSGVFEYSTDLFEVETIERLAGHFQELLQGIVADPQRPVGELPLLSAEQREQLLVQWNQTEREFAQDSCVHELFAQQAARTPGAVALVCGEEQLTYEELDRRSNQLAHRLRSQGVGPEVIVGLCLERSPQMVVGMLGILKAGAAYLPLDPEYPAARLQYMLADAQAPVLLTHSCLLHRLPGKSVRVLKLDEEMHELARQPCNSPARSASAESLAHLIYTSGSTGHPKGVCITHRSVVSLVTNNTYARVDERTHLLGAASVTFDAATFEIWSCLLNGGMLALLPERIAEARSIEKLAERHGLSLALLTPALFNSVTDLDPRCLSGIEELLVGGEALSVRHVVQANRALPGLRLINAYGPTECTTISCTYPIPKDFDANVHASVPIGRPVANAQVYVLDEELEPVPIGVSGELYIGGVGLARGYLKRAGLTAERFVASPFAHGERLYRTGDRVRRRGDGNLEFIGRLDGQVKLRGFRIELGEIEATLLSHPEVKQAVVLMQTESQGVPRVVGYVVGAPAAALLQVPALRAYLKEHLPEYMIPSVLMVLEEMPLTGSGKLDRQRLPAPQAAPSGAEYVAARTPVEETLAGIWSEVLQVPRVGIRDNFFELGGHSLLVIKMLSRVRQMLGVEVAIRALFDAPVIVEFASRIEELMRGTAQTEPLECRPRPRQERTELSFGQERLWFLEKLGLVGSAYTVPTVLRLSGKLDVDGLQSSLEQLIQRHESLRTRIETLEGRGVQVIDAPRSLPLAVEDLSVLPEGESRARELIQEEASRRFEVLGGPLFRVRLLRVNAAEHVLLLTAHHLITDGWSIEVLISELSELYQAHVQGRPSALTPLPVQYTDYAQWQREWLQGPRLHKQLQYWREQLTGAPAALELPTDHRRPPVSSFRGASVAFSCSSQLLQGLQQLARQEQATLFMTLMAAYQLLLSRWSGQADIVTGWPMAGRGQRGLEGLVGFFVNNLVLRTRVRREMSFRELLGQVKEAALGAYAHEDMPFEKLVQELQPGRDLSRQPLFQVSFALQPAAHQSFEWADLSVRRMPLQTQTSKFDLSLSMSEEGPGLSGVFQYATDLFERETIERLAGHLQVLLQGIVADPQKPVGDLALLSAEQREQLLVQWNQTERQFAQGSCVHELFAQQAARTPEAVALVCGDEQLTYEELDRRSNQLAQHLRKLGVGPETIVGLCLGRSLQMVVGLLGVLKAGGAYLPLDPEYPAERLAFMLEDARAPVVVTLSTLLARLPQSAARRVCLDQDQERIAECSDSAPDTGVSPGNLAYVIYTSGSTGMPKGALISHGCVTRLFCATERLFEFGPADVWTLFHSFAFDFSVWEIWGALFYGGRLLVVPFWISRSPESFYEMLRNHAVTVLSQTPSAFEQVIRVDGVKREKLALRLVIFGGEALNYQALRPWVERRGTQSPRLINMYGITETTVHVTHRAIDVADLEARAGSAIGRCLADLQGYVLDESYEPVPTGVAGELFVGGAGLARGYLRRSGLTAERFVASAFGDGKRLYRTGDRVRYRADGELEFLGRLDEQVKLRGFRIELGEIEAALLRHPSVRQAVVLVKKEPSPCLVGYVVAAEDAEVQPRTLRAYLKDSLPEHMVPGVFVVLDEMPLTRNGKIDRARLPVPQVSPSCEEYVAARTPVEETLAGIWSEVLEVPRVSIHDSFFELGGHSLLAVKMLSRVRQMLGVEVAIRALFDAPVIVEFASRIEELMRGTVQTEPLECRPRPRQERTELSFGQERLWFLEKLGLVGAAYTVPTVLRLSGKLDVDGLQSSLEQLIQRHESLRTRIETLEGRGVQVIDPAGSLPLAVEDLSLLPEDESRARELIQEEASRRFEVLGGPLFRVRLLRVNAAEHVLLLTAHHLITDGWSIEVLISELSELYQAHVQGRPPALAPLPVQYADYAQWQREWLQGPRLHKQLQYWREQLTGAPAALELPTDHRRPPVSSFRGASVAFSCSSQLLQGLQQLARQEQATLFMTLMAAYQLLLSRWSGQADIVTGWPMAGRGQRGLEGLVGFFVNNLVLRTRVRREMSFRELLGQVKEAALGAYAHEDMPFEKLVQELQPGRDLSRQPLFQVSFALQPAARQSFEWADLSVRRMPLQTQTSKFDLSLSMSEEGPGLSGVFHYATDLFEVETIERLAGHFQELLQGIVADPQRPVGELPLLSAGQREQLLVQWNQTQRAFAQDSCVHELFAQQAARTPEAVALVCAEEQLTYGELDRRSNQLAHHLRTLGAGPEMIVGLCVERSPQMIVGLLGILKAGAAYLPLDPEYPAARLQYMLADAQASILLTHSTLVPRLPDQSVRVVRLDEQMHEWAQQRASAPVHCASAQSLAYVIYTSGSTGHPKGVCVTHRSIVSLATNNTYAQVEERTHLLGAASVTFDAATFEIWGCLLNGGMLALLPERIAEASSIQKLAQRHGLSLGWLTAALFNSVIDVDPRCLSGIQKLLIGGEALSLRHVAQANQALPGLTLVNGYGPTECTTFSCTYPIPKDFDANVHASVPIGRPIANAQVYVLDEELEPVPIGVSGELYIGGVGLARGYLKRAGLTAERFVASPFGEGERLYRTGDRVRYLADGNLQFLGRTDQQVKLRGFRIELGEIEATLLSHPEVKQAVVLMQTESQGVPRVVGYVVGAPAAALLQVPALRAYLKEHLPEYMIPSVLMVLEEMPLTGSGKLDRQRLPAPQAAPSGAEYVAARTPVEETLAGIWSEVLQVPRVGIRDNFFELGGHSLLVIKMLSRVRQMLGVEVAIRALFDAPVIVEFASRIEELMRGTAQTEPLECRPRPRQERTELSFGQERLWFLEKLGLVGSAYTVPTVLRLSGKLDVDGLQSSLEQLIQRHESLRTRIETLEGRGVQVIDAPRSLPLAVEDLSVLPEGESRARELIQEEASRRFEVLGGPLFRVRLLRVNAAEHVLLLTAHHLITDGWSIEVLISELSELYQAHVQGRPSALTPLPVQYTDYAQWQREWLQGPRLHKQLQYWREQLTGAPAALELPTDHRRPPVSSFRGASVAFSCSSQLLQGLQQLARQEQATLFMTLMAAYQLLLSRWSGQADIVTGWPMAGRGQRGLEGLVGFFVNNLVLRTRVRREMSFRELLGQVKEAALGAYAHEDMPFEKLVQELQPGRDLSRQPLFQVSFALQPAAHQSFEWADLSVRRMPLQTQTSKFDLSLSMSEEGPGLSGVFQYATDLFERETIERLAGHLQVLLQGIVADPQKPVGDLALLSAEQREQLLVQWNQTERQFAQGSCVHELFAQQAARTPEAVALVCGDEQLTYEELDRRSNQLAQHLRKLGVGPETIVGLCLERSPQMIVGLLGILKAGAAYLPLDPGYPPDRLAYMLANAAPRVVLIQERFRELVAPTAATIVALDGEWEQIAQQPSESVDARSLGLRSHHLAYVIYTSGSTGQPKGVAITHSGIVNRLQWMQAEYGLTAADRVLQKTPYSFDVSVWEFFWPLLYGARLVVARPGGHQDPDYLAGLIGREGITTMHFVPPMLEAFLSAADVGCCGSLRQVMCSGQALSLQLSRRFFEALPGVQLHNLYGPTEASVDVSYFECRSDSGLDCVPIGRPIWNTRLYVLDRNLDPAPVGVVGELHIGGVCLARGYLNRPELTAEKFIADPYGEAGSRLYKTGDLVRWRQDGTIEYLGRNDFQVKIRGFRIELGEIEARLRGCPGVHQAVIVAHQVTGEEQKQLVGYVVPAPGELPDVPGIRAQLALSLPQYMVPALFVFLTELPLTPSGKVNQAALPPPDASERPKGQYIAARTPIEATLAQIWADSLHLQQVGVHDNFFDLGGDSLTMIRVLSKVNVSIDAGITIVDLFRFPTISELSAHCGSRGAAAQGHQESRRSVRRRSRPRRSANFRNRSPA